MIPKMRMVVTSSVVATGRRMNGSAKFMTGSRIRLPRPSAAAAAPSVLCPCRGRRAAGALPRVPVVHARAGVRRSCPSVTTSSPAAQSFRDDDLVALLPLHLTLSRISTVRSGLTTKTILTGLRRLDRGRRHDDRRSDRCCRTSVTCTNEPGQSAWSSLANVPFILIVPVVASTVLSMKLTTLPDSRVTPEGADRRLALRHRRPARKCCRPLRAPPAERREYRRAAARFDDERLLRLVGGESQAGSGRAPRTTRRSARAD